MTEFERRRVAEQYRDAAHSGTGDARALAIKGASLAAVLALVVLAVRTNSPADELSVARRAQPSAPYRPMLNADWQSKAAFDERRRRYMDAHPDLYLAREAATRQIPGADSDGGYHHYPAPPVIMTPQ